MATTTATRTITKQAPGTSMPSGSKRPATTSENKPQNQGLPTTRQESVEFVQILMLVAVSTILEQRNLLPFDGFEDRELHNIRKDIRGVVSDGSESPTTQTSAIKKVRGTKRFNTVNRQSSAATEKLYTWLDGIFHGIEQEYIESVQMNVIAEKHKPEHVLESYLFSLQYKTGSTGQGEVGVALSSSLDVRSVTVLQSRASIYSVIRYLSTLLNTLPELPATRFLAFNLFFTEKCPVGFSPTGFKVSNQSTMLVPDNTQWKMETSIINPKELGSHSVKVNIAYLKQPRWIIQDDASVDKAPSGLVFNKMLSRTTFKPLSDGNIVLSKSNLFGNRSKLNTPSTPSTMSDVSLIGMSQSSLGRGFVAEVSDAQIQGPGSVLEQQLERGPDTSSIRERLLAMARSQSTNSRLTQTQEVTVLEEIDGEVSAMMLVTDKDEELYYKRERFLAQPGFVSSEASVQCECGAGVQEGGMISCDCCDKWQHKHCYALDRAPNDILGNPHVCYDCLLSSTDPEVFAQLQDAARLRRMCWMIRNSGLSISKKRLLEKLGGQELDALDCLEALLDAGLIKISKDVVKLDAKAADANFENHGFLHPLRCISHLFEVVSLGGINSSPPRGQKRGVDYDDQMTSSSDSQDLEAMVPNKKRKTSNLPCTPPHHHHRAHAFCASMETLSPATVSGEI